MTRREQAYNRKIKELIKKTGRLEDREVKKVLAILSGARTEVAAAVASTEWQVYHIPQLKEAIARAIEGFRQQYLAGQGEALSNVWNAGIDAVDSPLQYVGVRFAAPEISRTALEIMQGYSADLIQGLSADALKKVNNEITLGIMGQKQPTEVMKAIGRNLDDPGVFKAIGHRAETITRTEMARVHSSARQARMEGTVEMNPEMGWQKEWVSSGKSEPRENHANLNGVTVPVNMDFSMYGGSEPVPEGAGIAYPHAPGLPAKEVVNCG